MKVLGYLDFTNEAKNPCWSGYKQIGSKKKGSKMVPNCVPIREEEEEEDGYSFDELPQEAKKRAIDINRDMFIEGFDWWEDIIDEFTSELESIGMDRVKCDFSGFYSQGDGASFTGRVSDNKKFLQSIKFPLFNFDLINRPSIKEKFKKLADDFCDNIYIEIVRNSSRYYHESSIEANVELDGEENIELDLGVFELGGNMKINMDKMMESVESWVTEWARKSSKDLYRRLEKDYDSLTSDETVAEELESGGYRFDKKGNMI